ncbi:MAG: hypothetical protein ACLPQS_11535 [Acidimicrobiales bacterium]
MPKSAGTVITSFSVAPDRYYQVTVTNIILTDSKVKCSIEPTGSLFSLQPDPLLSVTTSQAAAARTSTLTMDGIVKVGTHFHNMYEYCRPSGSGGILLATTVAVLPLSSGQTNPLTVQARVHEGTADAVARSELRNRFAKSRPATR